MFVPRSMIRFFMIMSLFLMVISSVGCKGKMGGGGHGPGSPGFKMPPANVVGFKVVERSLEDKINMIGTLEANEQVEIKSEIEGTVEEVLFQEGQAVKKGDVLFRIDQKKLQVGLDEAQANFQLAQATSKRYEELVKTLAVSKQEYDEKVASLESNRAAVELTQEQLNDATITAPFDGLMSERLVSQGQFVSKGASLGSIIDQDPIKVSFYIPERHLGEIKTGQKISMTVAAYPDKTFTGEVYFIDPQINAETRAALVKAYVPNNESYLKPGMFASLGLITSVRPTALVIPETALMINAQQTSVYAVDGEQAVHLRPVTVGMRFEGMVEVKEGLSAGETVIVEGIQKAHEGAKVNVRFEGGGVEVKK